jgi:nucleotide-binding universal stress UspA family protein
LIMKNILVGTDGSDGAGRAIDLAAELAKTAGGRLIIVTVVTPLRADEQEQVRQYTRIEGSTTDPTEVLAKQALSDAEERARKSGLTSARTKILWGDPTEALINAIRDEKADAVVVGRRGHGRLAGLLLGSVSQKLASLAPCVAVIAP